MRLFWLSLSFLFTVFALNGCATAYQKTGISGGYFEAQLDKNVFTIQFDGNGYTSTAKATDFTLLRSAEVAMEHGFKYFSIVDSDTFRDNSSYTVPVVNNTTTDVDVNVRNIGDMYYADVETTTTTTTTGGQTYNISRPSSSNTIVCYEEKPKGLFTHNAWFVVNSIKDKYEIK